MLPWLITAKSERTEQQLSVQAPADRGVLRGLREEAGLPHLSEASPTGEHFTRVTSRRDPRGPGVANIDYSQDLNHRRVCSLL